MILKGNFDLKYTEVDFSELHLWLKVSNGDLIKYNLFCNMSLPLIDKGKGTYGAVVSATNKENGKGVAIKKLSKIEDIVSCILQ